MFFILILILNSEIQFSSQILPSSFNFFFNKLNILEKFEVHSILRKRYKISHSSQTCVACPIINIFHQSGSFVTTNEPTMTHHCHSKSIVYIRTNSWCCVVPYIVLDKCIMPYMHHYNILQSSFIALKILLLLPSQSLLISGNLIFLMLPEFLTLWVFVLLFFFACT